MRGVECAAAAVPVVASPRPGVPDVIRVTSVRTLPYQGTENHTFGQDESAKERSGQADSLSARRVCPERQRSYLQASCAYWFGCDCLQIVDREPVSTDLRTEAALAFT